MSSMKPSERKRGRPAGSAGDKKCDKLCPRCGELNSAEDSTCTTCEQPLKRKRGRPAGSVGNKYYRGQREGGPWGLLLKMSYYRGQREVGLWGLTGS